MTSNSGIDTVYQVQGNLADGIGERVFYAAVNRSVAEWKMTKLESKHKNLPWGGGFRIVKTVAE